jgi:hypothetical protein
VESQVIEIVFDAALYVAQLAFDVRIGRSDIDIAEMITKAKVEAKILLL